MTFRTNLVNYLITVRLTTQTAHFYYTQYLFYRIKLQFYTGQTNIIQCLHKIMTCTKKLQVIIQKKNETEIYATFLTKSPLEVDVSCQPNYRRSKLHESL